MGRDAITARPTRVQPNLGAVVTTGNVACPCALVIDEDVTAALLPLDSTGTDQAAANSLLVGIALPGQGAALRQQLLAALTPDTQVVRCRLHPTATVADAARTIV